MGEFGRLSGIWLQREVKYCLKNQGIVWEAFRSHDIDLTISDLDEVSALDTLEYAGVDRDKTNKYESLIKKFGFSEDEAFKVYLNDVLHENA